MASSWGNDAASKARSGEQRSQRRALGASDRRRWSSLVRQNDIAIVQAYIADPQLLGAVILGPPGVGKTTLARNVAHRLEESSHVVSLFGTGVPTEVPYSIFTMQMARLNARQSGSPSAILGAVVEQIFHEASGRPIVIVLDELPGIDTLSMGILMHMILSGKAKLLVVARSATDLSEDLVWMVRDGLLAQQRLAPFTRVEVRRLLVKALEGPVAESVVATLFAASGGNPLVLHALVHEYLNSGVLRANEGVWVQAGRLEKRTDDVLFDLVESRLARESPQMRINLEKFSLLKNVPLAVAIQGLGSDAVTALEEHGFMAIASDHSRTVSFAEPFVGETVRNQLSPSKKADYFREFSSNFSFDVAELSPQEVLTYASWMNEAGLVMEPDVAVAAAQTALQLFDPHLALACARHVPLDHPLAVLAAQKRSRAHYLMADYSKAAEVLEAVDSSVLETLSTADYAAWSMDLATALVWLPGTRNRVDEVLGGAASRIEEASGDDRLDAEKFYNVARFEVHANRGEFSQVLDDLKIASKDRYDRTYRLNCCCLLTMALTATGQELDAIKLSQEILEEAERFDVVLRMQGWQMYGSILAHIWSGQWSSCEKTLQHGIDYSNSALHYQGGVIELALGVLYAFAGRDMDAAEILLVAAAQLEVRNTYTSSEVVYSALACVFARLEDPVQARHYLLLAQESGPQNMWVSRTLSDYFQSLAAHALGDVAAVGRLAATAEQDLSAGRAGPAASGLRAAVICGGSALLERLGEAAQYCQGEMAALSMKLAKAVRAQGDDGPRIALDVAMQSHRMELVDMERYATELALELATTTGDKRLQREAKTGLRGLEWAEEQKNAQGPGVVALTPRELQVARHAIRGMSNRDIAKKIGVSVRTVEGHLYQVFAKLGITSRTELEKWVNL